MLSYLKFGAKYLGGLLQGAKSNWSSTDDIKSIYNNSNNALNVSANLYEAVKLYAGKSKRKAYMATTYNGTVVELESTDGSSTEIVRCIFDGNNNVQIHGATVDNNVAQSGTIALLPYKIWERSTNFGYSGTAVLLAIMPLILNNEEGKELYDELQRHTQWDDDDPHWNEVENGVLQNLQDFSFDLCRFTDNVYRRITSNGTGDARIYLPDDNKDIKDLSQGELKIKTVKEIVGEPQFFSAPVKLASTIAAFGLPVNYSKEDAARVQKVDAKEKVAEWVSRTAKMIFLSSKYAEPIRTAYFIGPSGCGKTIGATQLAKLLGLVYDHITCNPDMEIFDFFGQIYPNTTPTKKIDFNDIRNTLDLPSVEDIIMDKESAYIQMFHMPMPANTEEADIIAAMVNKVNAEVANLMKDKDYTFVEGVLTKAIRNGYLCEIQEIGIVKRPGVAVGLNAVLESGKYNFVQLPTGEVLEKNPNCVLVFTSNDEYEGTCNLNQSVLSRMAHVEYFSNASVDQMVERTMQKVPDFYSKKELKKMAKTIEEINKHCSSNGISDGVCGQRELNNWAMEIMCDLQDFGIEEATMEILRSTCRTAVLNKVAQNVEDIEDVAAACVNASYGELPVRLEVTA